MKAVIYARVSSKGQEREGYSIPAQLKLLREYAQKNNFAIQQEFVDVETAKMAGRKNFGEMVQYLEKSPDCRTVIAEKTDRLYRNLRDCLTLEDMNIEIHLPKEGQIIQQRFEIPSEANPWNSRCPRAELRRKLERRSKEGNAGKSQARNLSQPPAAGLSQ